MRTFPCRLCDKCGRYSDFTVLTCACGRDLSQIPASPVDQDVYSEHLGEIHEEIPVYVQKCSYCGALSFTEDPAHPVRICFRCHRARISGVKPVPYEEKEPEQKQTSAIDSALSESSFSVRSDSKEPLTQKNSVAEEKNREKEQDTETPFWGSLLESTNQAAVGAGPTEQRDTGIMKKPDNEVMSKLTLTAIQNRSLSTILKSSEAIQPYMLGRSANFSAFLNCDGYVSNEHCFITCRAGTWFVTDNNSSNGTFINSDCLESGGQRELREGDRLILGHFPSSPAFHISIE